ncbi:DNA-binding transcriptional LysR family regulator [Scopulibacillus daqui]|uniref:DNA-binding transcriptional LysR family regulator n=1 Tax=Scopulibacillus daqui TaxID=1469162 RepID=A0ABS2Q2E0_9BACL|nr:LysR family transcriptional regulator [Scopulibacillus daqui]MBM7645712.1 DNA-binding transcriptional LysR family regulator [Scopulibacillus daqui]
MDVRHLQYFLEVVKQKSFTKAAETLHITQPTISKMIKDIEDEYGVPLLERTGRKAVMTDAGEIVFKHAQKIVQSFDDLTNELSDLMNIKRGKITIGLPPMVGAYFFPRVLGRFREAYPDIMIQVFEAGAKKVMNDVESGALEIGVVVQPVDLKLFHTISFVKESLRLVVHPEHPLAVKEEVKLIELKDEPFILFREDFALHDQIIQTCIQAGYKPKIAYESSQWDFISQLAAAKLGVALLPETICKELNRKKVSVIKLVEPVIPWQLAIVWRKDRYLSFAAREWIAFTKKFL